MYFGLHCTVFTQILSQEISLHHTIPSCPVYPSVKSTHNHPSPQPQIITLPCPSLLFSTLLYTTLHHSPPSNLPCIPQNTTQHHTPHPTSPEPTTQTTKKKPQLRSPPLHRDVALPAHTHKRITHTQQPHPSSEKKIKPPSHPLSTTTTTTTTMSVVPTTVQYSSRHSTNNKITTPPNHNTAQHRVRAQRVQRISRSHQLTHLRPCPCPCPCTCPSPHVHNPIQSNPPTVPTKKSTPGPRVPIPPGGSQLRGGKR